MMFNVLISVLPWLLLGMTVVVLVLVVKWLVDIRSLLREIKQKIDRE